MAQPDAYLEAKVKALRWKAEDREQTIRQMLEARGFIVRAGILMDDQGVFYGSVEE